MKTYHSIFDFHSENKTIVTLGTFDGVHIGHQMIVQKLIDAAREMKGESLVLTFFPHPRMVLEQDHSIKLLNTIAERKQLLEKFGLNSLVIHKFDEAFSQLEAEDFVKQILVDQFNVGKIIIGYDHRFGKNRSADLEDLKRYGQKYNFSVEEISAQEIHSVSVSSTKIRKALEGGDVALANEFLGYSYGFSAVVVHGKKMGRTLGYPTANLEIDETYKLVPKKGVYVVSAVLDGQLVKGMMSIGWNPTFEKHPHTIEVNFLDWHGDLYGRTLQISMHQYVRDEVKFESLDALKVQLAQDEKNTRAYFEAYV